MQTQARSPRNHAAESSALQQVRAALCRPFFAFFRGTFCATYGMQCLKAAASSGSCTLSSTTAARAARSAFGDPDAPHLTWVSQANNQAWLADELRWLSHRGLSIADQAPVRCAHGRTQAGQVASGRYGCDETMDSQVSPGCTSAGWHQQ